MARQGHLGVGSVGVPQFSAGKHSDSSETEHDSVSVIMPVSSIAILSGRILKQEKLKHDSAEDGD
jgi:hypothetical protein